MATIKATVHKHKQKEDKTWNVKVHIYHNGRPADNDTAYYVTKSQLTAKFKIKDPYVLGSVNDIIKGYWKSIEKLGREIDRFTARELADYLEKQDSKKLSGGRIDFIRFGEGHLLEVKKRNRAMRHFSIRS